MVQDAIINEGYRYIFSPYTSTSSNITGWAVTDACNANKSHCAIAMTGFALCDWVYDAAHTGLFGVITTSSEISNTIMKLLSIRGARTMALMVELGEDSSFFMQYLVEMSKTANIEIVAVETTGKIVDRNDVRKKLISIINLKPDVLIGLALNDVCYEILTVLKEFNFMPKALIPGFCVNDPRTVEMLGDDARFLLTITQWTKNIQYRDPYLNSNANVVALMEAAVGSELVNEISASAIASGLVIQSALEHISKSTNEMPSYDELIRGMKLINEDFFFGRINLDKLGRNMGKEMPLLQVSPSGELKVIAPVTHSEMEFIYPAPTWDERTYKAIIFDGRLPLSVAIICMIGVAAMMFLIGFMVFHKKKPVIKDSGLIYCCLVCFGTALMYTSTFLLQTLPTNQTCLLQFWFFGIGFNITYCCYISKLVHVWRVTQQRGGTTSFDFPKVVLVFMIPELLILLLMTVAQPITAPTIIVDELRPSKNYSICNASSFEFLLIYALYNTGLSVCGVLFALRLRKALVLPFNEVRFITVSVINTMPIFSGILTIIGFNLIAGNAKVISVDVFKSFSILIGATSSCIAFIGPKIYMIVLKDGGYMQKENRMWKGGLYSESELWREIERLEKLLGNNKSNTNINNDSHNDNNNNNHNDNNGNNNSNYHFLAASGTAFLPEIELSEEKN